MDSAIIGSKMADCYFIGNFIKGLAWIIDFGIAESLISYYCKLVRAKVIIEVKNSHAIRGIVNFNAIDTIINFSTYINFVEFIEYFLIINY